MQRNAKRTIPYSGREVWMDPATTFTRQEIAELTGLSDDVLSFWSKRRLLIHVEGGGQKGVPRRYDATQINIAAILAVYRDHFGANISTLTSLSDLMQRSVSTFRKVPSLPHTDWVNAAELADDLDAFRNGKPVMVRAHHWDDPGYNDLDIDEQLKRRPATSETEILTSLEVRSDCPAGLLIRSATILGAGHVVEARVARVVEGLFLDPGYAGDEAWLIRQTESGWEIEWSSEDLNFNLSDPGKFGPAAFIPVGPLLRSIWKMPNWRELRAKDHVDQAAELLAAAGLSATVAPSSRRGCELDIVAPQATHDAIYRVLVSHKYYFELRDPSETEDALS